MTPDDAVRASAQEVEALAADVGAGLLAKLGTTVEGPGAAKVAAQLKLAATYKARAVIFKDEAWAGAAESCLRSAKTIALAEAVVASDEEAASFHRAASIALDAFEFVLQKVLTAVFTAALAAGTGGAGPGIGGVIAGLIKGA